MALLGPREMSDLSPQSRPKQTLSVGRYTKLGFPALKKGGHVADTGMINQLVHIWKFRMTATGARTGRPCSRFVEGFASKFRPLVMSQEVKLMTEAPWGPHP